MILKILQYIRGYLRIRITGYSTERFLNACSHKGIRLWNLQASGNFYEMNITISGFRQIRAIARKTGTRVVIIRRIGLPFFFFRYRKRKLFFAGIILGIGLLTGLSQFIWNIDIRGNLTRTDEVLLDFLQTRDVRNGMRISQVDCERIVKDIRKEYDDIIWVSASIEGTRLTIQVKENEDSIEVKEEDTQETATDIVADQDCVVTSIITRKGVPMIQEGMEVHKGDTLISGQVPVHNDAQEIIGYQEQRSEADILGQTSVIYEDHYPVSYIKKEENRQVKMSEYYVQIRDIRMSFGSVRTTSEYYELHSSERQIRMLDNFYLPVVIGKRSVKPYDPVEKKHTKSQIRKILSDRFLRYCEDLDKKGVEIIQNDVKIYTGSKEASAQGTLTVIMPVGKTMPSAVPEISAQPEENE